MKIQKIELTNYKAFLGTHKIQVGGKNVFIYGKRLPACEFYTSQPRWLCYISLRKVAVIFSRVSMPAATARVRFSQASPSGVVR